MQKHKNKQENLSKKQRKSKNKQRGITLIALVITIIILIILSLVTINFAFGENKLIKRAQNASEMYANDTAYADASISNVMMYINEILANASIEESGKSEVAIAKENETSYSNRTMLKDDLGNTIYIPGGFHLSKDSGTKVEDGIVIEDDTENNNQFVWIPTGTYNTEEGLKTNKLTRRQWATTEDLLHEPVAINGDEEAIELNNSVFLGEGDSRSCTISGNTNSIDNFLSSAKPVSEGGYGGFYIGRYEQGTGNVCKSGVDVYSNITRNEAKTKSEEMYSENPEIKATTQLISSYAWDTALNFICQNSEFGYTLAKAADSKYGNIATDKPAKTGKTDKDCYSNIFDFIGNYLEYTTEYSDTDNYPCVYRGGHYGYSYYYPSIRCYELLNSATEYISFRVQLYV